MGSTLRSLVLAYKADTKDFRKGSEAVKADIGKLKGYVKDFDKQLDKTFALKTEPLRAGIRKLNEDLKSGAISAAQYTKQVGALGEKIANLRQANKVAQIGAADMASSHRKMVASAMINRDLRRNYMGGAGLGESSADIIARMGGGGMGRGGGEGGGLFNSLVMSNPYGHLIPKPMLKTLMKFGKAGGGAFAAYKAFDQTYDSAVDMAKEGPGTIRGSQGMVARDSFKSVFGGLSNILPKVGEVPAGMLAEFGNKLSGGALDKSRDMYRAAEKDQQSLNDWDRKRGLKREARQPETDFQDELEAQREIARLVEQKSMASLQEMRAEAEKKGEYDESHKLSLAIVEAKKQALELTRQEKAAEQAKRDAIEGSLTAMREEAAVGELMATGMSEAAARIKVAGGTADDVKNAGFLAAKIQAQRDEATRKATRGDDYSDTLFDAAQNAMKAAADQAKSVSAFGQQFENPAEQFKRRAEEIRKYRDQGLSPEIMERAMQANAAAFSGSRMGNFGAANVLTGSAESMKLAEQAKIGDRQEKGIEELVKIQKEALKNAQENKPLEINVQNVSI